jgi:DNA-directed RNA polymerase subunit E'
MFKIITLEDVVRVPPNLLGLPVKSVVEKILNEKYQGAVLEGIGYVVRVLNFEIDASGKIVPGDGGSYHKTQFSVVSYLPEVQEVTTGKVVETEDFGAFIKLGPFDALLHVSQMTDDFIDYNKSQATLVGRKTGRKISKGDKVRVRVVAVSIGSVGGDKVGVTTRQPYLGKDEWIKEDLKKFGMVAKNG